MSAQKRAPKPQAIWLGAFLASAALVWGLIHTVEFVRSGALHPLSPFPSALMLALGIVGFWFMRWWGLAVALLAAIHVCVLAFIGRAPAALFIMAAYCLPMIVAAIVCRRRFQW